MREKTVEGVNGKQQKFKKAASVKVQAQKIDQFVTKKTM